MKTFTITYEDKYGIRATWRTQAETKNDAREQFRRHCPTTFFEIVWIASN